MKRPAKPKPDPILPLSGAKKSHHRKPTPHHDRCCDVELELIMATIADLTAQVASLQVSVDALKNQPAPVATQADLDTLSAGLTAVQTTLDALPKPV